MRRLSSRARTSRPRLEALEDRTALSASPIGDLVIFGDSLSDAGNVSAVTAYLGQPSPFGYTPPGAYFTTSPLGLPQTRFSSGPVWAETLADALGEGPVSPSFLGGLDFSFGGASLSEPSFFGVPQIGAQVDMYLAGHAPTPDDLFAFWAGSNDFFSDFAQDPGDGSTLDPVTPAQTLVGQVMRLANEPGGARRFVINTLTPLGGTPYFQDLAFPEPLKSAIIAGANQWAEVFNSVLTAGLAGVQAAHPDAVIVVNDTYSLFNDWARPANEPGFSNWTQAVAAYNGAQGSGGLLVAPPGPDTQDYLFFDSVHPGAKAHALLGLNAAAGVLTALGQNHLTVTTTADAIDPLDGGRSLREALALADLMPGEQTVTFALGHGPKTINLNSQLDIKDDLTLIGGPSVTISGQGQTRLFNVAAGADVAIAALRLIDGKADQGGAIFNAGSLTLVGVLLSGNHARQGGAIYNADGASLDVFASLIANNTAGGGSYGTGQGGGIFVASGSTARLYGSVVTSNTAVGGKGGGVYVADDGDFALCASLVLGNNAKSGKNIFRD